MDSMISRRLGLEVPVLDHRLPASGLRVQSVPAGGEHGSQPRHGEGAVVAWPRLKWKRDPSSKLPSLGVDGNVKPQLDGASKCLRGCWHK